MTPKPSDPARERQRERGFTLLEVLVGMSLMAYLMLSVVSFSVLSMQLNQLAEQRTIATSLAADRLQQIVAVPLIGKSAFQNYRLPEETADAGPPRRLVADYGTIPGFSQYRRVVELRYDVPTAGMLTAETSVSWAAPDGTTRTHTLVTFLQAGLR